MDWEIGIYIYIYIYIVFGTGFLVNKKYKMIIIIGKDIAGMKRRRQQITDLLHCNNEAAQGMVSLVAESYIDLSTRNEILEPVRYITNYKAPEKII